MTETDARISIVEAHEALSHALDNWDDEKDGGYTEVLHARNILDDYMDEIDEADSND